MCYTNGATHTIQKEERMAFAFTNSKGNTYYLHSKVIKRPNGKEGRLFYFSKEQRLGETLDAVPAGYTVVEMKTGLPALKKV
jgi:hypothetical protein